ncbi:hypothetical protein ACF8MH_00940 [Pseudomonas sp. YQ_13]|uniref:hypothetical protein n=1 Tax=Pseudomonas sp. YQ_13 TaxID=3367235 RepID=UPI00370C916D
MALTDKDIAETMNRAIEWGKDGRLQAAIGRLIALMDSGEVSVQDVPPLLALLEQGNKEARVLKFDLSGVNAGCAYQWRYVFKHAQQALAHTLKEALVTYPGPLDANGQVVYPTYKVVVYPSGDFNIQQAHGKSYLVNDEIEHAAQIIGASEQPDGLYIFSKRYCLCPDGSTLFYD